MLHAESAPTTAAPPSWACRWPGGSAGDRLLEALGHEVRWTSWVLEVPAGGALSSRPPPVGYVVRAAVEAEHAAVHDLQERAFLE